ncbi:MAG: hypothetical protein D6725_02085 [Planctomycetota bacterium]|nr:MAG: hypothetical protein D6725_02085 [Planctomycetota bacterium]
MSWTGTMASCGRSRGSGWARCTTRPTIPPRSAISSR